MAVFLITPETRERFWQNVKKGEGDDACWQWLGTLHRVGGYARFFLEGKSCLANRFAYEAEHGPLDKDMALVPSCNNRGCVRPSHWSPMPVTEACKQRGQTVVLESHEACSPLEMLHVKHSGAWNGPTSKGPALVESAAPPSCNVFKTVPLFRKIGLDVGTVVATIPQLATVRDIHNVAKMLGDVVRSVELLSARLALLEVGRDAHRQEEPQGAPEATAAAHDEAPDEAQPDEGQWLDELWVKVGHGPPDRERMASLFDAALSQRPHGPAALYLLMEWGADFKRSRGRPAESPAELEEWVTSSGLLVSPA